MITALGAQNGVADAAKSFLDAYTTMRGLNQKDEEIKQQGLLRDLQMEATRQGLLQNKVQTNMAAKTAGVLIDPSTGAISDDPARQQEKQIEKEFEYNKAGFIPKYEDQPGQGQGAGLLPGSATPENLQIDPNTGLPPQAAIGKRKLVGFTRDPDDPNALWKKGQGLKLMSDLEKSLADRDLSKQKFGFDKDKFQTEMDYKQKQLAQALDMKAMELGYIRNGTKDDGTPNYTFQGKPLSPLQDAQMQKIKAETANLKIPKKAKAGVGQQSLDRVFAKDYDDWTSVGSALADKNLQRLEDAKQTLMSGKGGGLLGFSGKGAGWAPDFLKSNTAIRVRDDVRAAAQGALKATLGSQFTEKEGERIMDSAYNEKLSPEENVRKIDMAITELKTMKDAKNAKANFWEENNGTLEGYRAGMPAPGSSGAATKVVNGVTYQKVGDKWKKAK
jgi:hypothetical protein